MNNILVVVLVGSLLAVPVAAESQSPRPDLSNLNQSDRESMPIVSAEEDEGVLATAERLAEQVELQRARGRRPIGRTVTTLALIGAGIGLAVMAKPDYVPSEHVPSQYARGNTPRLVNLSDYLGPGLYTGHSYQLTRRRGADYGKRWVCTNRVSCFISNTRLVENYTRGYGDGYDDGLFVGRVTGHEEGWDTGWQQGQWDTISILNTHGLKVYQGEFTPDSYVPESYVKEKFTDKQGLRIAGVGLAAVGAIVALFWPDSPARSLNVTPVPGGGQIGGSIGF